MLRNVAKKQHDALDDLSEISAGQYDIARPLSVDASRRGSPCLLRFRHPGCSVGVRMLRKYYYTHRVYCASAFTGCVEAREEAVACLREERNGIPHCGWYVALERIPARKRCANLSHAMNPFVRVHFLPYPSPEADARMQVSYGCST
jgi:hypothetical protein